MNCHIWDQFFLEKREERVKDSKKSINMGRKICVILVNYNGKKYNDKCISSIQKSIYVGEIQILIVDNASTERGGSMIVVLKSFHWKIIMVFQEQIM